MMKMTSQFFGPGISRRPSKICLPWDIVYLAIPFVNAYLKIRVRAMTPISP